MLNLNYLFYYIQLCKDNTRKGVPYEGQYYKRPIVRGTKETGTGTFVPHYQPERKTGTGESFVMMQQTHVVH